MKEITRRDFLRGSAATMAVAALGLNAGTSQAEEETYDFGGRVVRIGAYYDMTPDPDSSEYDAAYAERIAYVEENYNCKIEFVDLGGEYVSQYVTSVLAGDPIVDIGYILSYTLVPSLIEGGIAYPVSDLGVFDFDNFKWSKVGMDAGYYKGKYYALSLAGAGCGYGIFWNKTLFEQYGLPDLYELYENDEWTWDKFKEIAIAGNIDTDNDGVIDIYGFNARENLEWCYMYSNGAYVADKTDTGIKVDLSAPEVVEALTALQDFTTTVDYRKIDWSVDSWNSLITDFRDGLSMMCLEAWWISYGYLGDMSDDWGFVPFPKGYSATEWSSYNKETGTLCMLNGIEDPEIVAKIYDLITDVAESEEELTDMNEASLEAQANDAESVEIVDYLADVSIINGIYGFTDLNSAVNSLFSDVTSGASTPGTAIETYQSQIDAAIADLENYDYDAEMQEYLEEETEAE